MYMNFWNFVNMRHCAVHVAIITFWIINYNNSSFDLSHTYINKRTHARTHTYTHTHTHTHTHTCKIKIFNENVRSNKDSGQTERNKLKYLHYLNKMIEKCKVKNFIFSEVSCLRFYLDLKWLHLSFGIQWTPFTDISQSKQPL